jgi:acetyl esterase/lipase
MDMDRAYSNGTFIAGGDSYPARWTAEAARFRDTIGPQTELGRRYGPGERNRLDLFHPEGPARGLLVFVHGGYWMAFGRESWSHLAAGALARGWACAMPSYTLAPEARISAMTSEIVQAVTSAAEAVDHGPVVVTGHSAGGQLSARVGCADLPPLPRLKRVVPISPLADLDPLRATQMNATLHLDAAEVAAESPALHRLRDGVQAHVWVGGQERPAFLWQARTLSEAWDCPWTVAPGRHHFDVIDDLAKPDSGLCVACMDNL